MQTTKQTVLAQLNALGATPWEIAASLREAGVTGRRGDCSACPLARWLALRNIGWAVEVGSNYATFECGVAREWVFAVVLPYACQAFIYEVDCKNDFPDLIEPGCPPVAPLPPDAPDAPVVVRIAE